MAKTTKEITEIKDSKETYLENLVEISNKMFIALDKTIELLKKIEQNTSKGY